MRKLIKYLKPYALTALLAPLSMLVEVSSELIMPQIMSNIVNTGIANNDTAYILSRGLIMIIIAFLGICGGIGCTVFSSKAAISFGTDVREELVKKIQGFSFVNLDKFHTSSLVTRLTNDITQIQQIVIMCLKMLIRSPLLFIGGMIMVFTINTRLTLILVTAVAILAVIIVIIMRKTFPRFMLVQEKIDNVNTVMRETLSGIRVIKAFVREEEEKIKFEEKNTELCDNTISAYKIMTLLIPVMMFTMNIVMVIVLWKGGNMVSAGKMATGDLMAYLTYLTQILMSFMMAGMTLMMITRGTASAERINEVLDCEYDIIDCDNPLENVISKGKIEFVNVEFSYPDSQGDPVLENINLTINPGETIGILGETGSGKSTLVNLIPRLYDVTKGSVKIDGYNVRNIKLEYLRKSIGIVLQKAILFSGTIKSNILWGREDATDDEIKKAAIDAQAYEYISKMEKGFDTRLEQMGVNLSGGQKQRLSIARTLIKRPKILILDDSTSALDTGTEAKIQKTMKEEYRDITKIIIAQKVTSVIQADKIVILESGKIAAIGPHSELINTSKTYQEIYNSQIRREED